MSSFWLNDPFVLIRADSATSLFPAQGMTMDEKLNALTRLVLLMALGGYAATANRRFGYMGAVTIVLIVVYHKVARPKVEEGMANEVVKIDRAQYTNPTLKNPFMNVLLPEINGAPNRKQGLPTGTGTTKLINTAVQSKMDPRLFKGTDNEMQFDNSMRNFYTTANTTVPNDDKGFREYLYSDMINGKTAKEGDPVELGRYKARLGGVYT